MKWIAAYAVAGVVFGLLDFLWLGKVGRPLYDARMGDWLAAKPNMTAAILFYLLYLVGLTYFVLVPALDAGSLGKAALSGFLFGLVAYATWNLTNLAVLKDFPSSIVPIDMAWGSLATMTTSIVTFLIVRALPFVERAP
ncbi:MAG: DUF2177 family protein [Actinobacteria bacterium]|jgi:uncharacterized membrane protein|nr:DUF2177 family protein [Actinomycetota bacterium]